MGRSIYCVVTAAGSGTRLGHNEPKALVNLAGKPILHHALCGLEPLGDLAGVAITAPANYLETFTQIAREAALSYPWTVLPGGSSRQKSVYEGLKGLLSFEPGNGQLPANDPTAIVLIHDAARALTPIAQFERVCQAVESGCPAVVPATELIDTVREVKGDTFTRQGLKITPAGSTPDRSRLRCVQTPQGFVGDIIFAAHDRAREESICEGEAVDDAVLVATLGHEQYFVPGSMRALKITYPLDLKLATWLAENPDRD
ncbi:IspD/TarI family cytidylyltransferase [Varibaculum timonense]|uniref:IspD/TarI family cytidylyltransferase n=1 Tax=Varibaculum timonense TaxID=1964383 RepID=UPI0022E66E1E|nr:IspD/TarI family cytidylyltransferase [Varibaculum timonense]